MCSGKMPQNYSKSSLSDDEDTNVEDYCGESE